MKSLFLVVSWFFKKLARLVYRVYRLSRVKFGKGCSVGLPLVVEGGGRVQFGDDCIIREGVEIGCADGARVFFGNGCEIESGATILIAKGITVCFGNNCKIEKNTILHANKNWTIKDGVVIASGCSIFSREIGVAGAFCVEKGTHIGDNTIIDLVDDVVIGSEVAIGPNSIIYTHDHKPADSPIAVWKGEMKRGWVEIEDGAWIGAKTVILPDIKIGSRAIVGAGAVVTRNVNPEVVVVGVPAKILRSIC